MSFEVSKRLYKSISEPKQYKDLEECVKSLLMEGEDSFREKNSIKQYRDSDHIYFFIVFDYNIKLIGYTKNIKGFDSQLARILLGSYLFDNSDIFEMDENNVVMVKSSHSRFKNNSDLSDKSDKSTTSSGNILVK